MLSFLAALFISQKESANKNALCSEISANAYCCYIQDRA